MAGSDDRAALLRPAAGAGPIGGIITFVPGGFPRRNFLLGGGRSRGASVQGLLWIWLTDQVQRRLIGS